eukprot:UN05423
MFTNCDSKSDIRINLETIEKETLIDITKQIFIIDNPAIDMQKLQTDINRGIIVDADPAMFWTRSLKAFT